MKQEWNRKSLAEIGSIFNGNSVSDSDKKILYREYNEGLPYIATKDIGFDNVINYNSGVMIPTSNLNDFKIAPPNTVLVCAEGGSAGRKIAHNDRSICFGNKLFVIAPTSLATSRYIFYFCLSNDFQTQFRNEMAGLIGGVSLNKFKKLTVPLPSLLEQQRIVTILAQAFEAISTAISNTEKNLANSREFFLNYLQSTFTKKNADWITTTLATILKTQPRNGWSPPAVNHSESGTPVLTLSSVTGFQFKPEKIKFTSAKTESHRHYWVKNGDLLITRSNTSELVGHVAIASGIETPTIYPDLIMRMNPDNEYALTEFIYYQLRTATLRNEITRRAQGASPTMKKISKNAVQTLPIHVPPINVQRDVVARINEIATESDNLEAVYQQKLVALDKLKKSILHQAFTGQLS